MRKLEHLENGTQFFYEILCFRWHILRSYRFVAEVTFKSPLSPLEIRIRVSERETNRETDRERQTERERERGRERKRDRERQRETERQRDRQ